MTVARPPRDKHPRPTAGRQRAGQPAPRHTKPPSRRVAHPPRRWPGPLLAVTEVALLALAGLILTITVLGRAAGWFGGTGLTESLLPFAGTVLILALSSSALLWSWLRLRAWLIRYGPSRPVIAATLVSAAALLFAMRAEFKADLVSLRSLVGGAAEAGRSSIGHQVYAAYRRADLGQLQTIMERSKPYLPVIREAARVNHVDAEVLIGIGAAESSFLPRASQDGGRGLFQITAPPRSAVAAASRQLGVRQPDVLSSRHNAYLAAATLRHYLDEMDNDLFLALLAYNIGPRNGGLRSIMQQYGARDFFTIQPYLQHLPRDYPIRVLTAALAYRLWSRETVLPRYEHGQNARIIQAIGIPGLDG